MKNFNSLNKIKKLPKETKIYFGHEYTKNNFNFCFKYEKKNKHLKSKLDWINQRLKEGLPTSPALLEEELKTNIFLRSENLDIKKDLKMKEYNFFFKIKRFKGQFLTYSRLT